MGVLRSLFGPSKEEIWSQIANEVGGKFIDGGFWKKDALHFRHKEWTIVLDTYTQQHGKGSTTYTRIRAPFVNKDGLYFNIHRENVFSSIGKFFGSKDILVDDPYFDEEFVIKGNSPDQIRKLLKSDKLKQLLSSIPKVHFKIKDDDAGLFSSSFPEGVDVLYFESVGVIKNTETLRKLFLLFCTVLERLVQIDSAYEDDPFIDLK